MKHKLKLAAVFTLLCLLLCIWGCSCMFNMPGKSYAGPLPALTKHQKAIAVKLKSDVAMLAKTIGQRNVGHIENYHRAADFIEKRFEDLSYTVSRQTYKVDGKACHNIIAELRGANQPENIVIVGAHYDSVFGTVGANDNASGIAGMLSIAEMFKQYKPKRTVRFVAFANEEPPFFQTERMGSLVYAKHCKKQKENITAMIALDGLGCYSDEENSQHYPFPFSIFYPTTGNFIAFIGNNHSNALVKQCIACFRKNARFPSEGGTAPTSVQGVGWSDHWAFWQVGYKACMVTDTLPFRFDHYHTTRDTPDKIDYNRMARVVEGLVAITCELTDSKTN